MTRSTVSSEHETARRLALPSPQLQTISEAREARECIGCHALYENRTRVVYALPECPAHSNGGQA